LFDGSLSFVFHLVYLSSFLLSVLSVCSNFAPDILIILQNQKVFLIFWIFGEAFGQSVPLIGIHVDKTAETQVHELYMNPVWNPNPHLYRAPVKFAARPDCIASEDQSRPG
jgi:hypothetical protein